MRTLLWCGAVALAAVNGGCGGGRSADSVRAGMEGCHTVSKRPLRRMASQHEYMVGERQLDVSLKRGEELCLEYDAYRKELRAVPSSVGPALGLAVTRKGTFFVNNRTDRIVVYQARVAVEDEAGYFDVDACPVPAGTGRDQKWTNEIVGIVLDRLALESSAPTPAECR
jgi:hypothetical protein